MTQVLKRFLIKNLIKVPNEEYFIKNLKTSKLTN